MPQPYEEFSDDYQQSEGERRSSSLGRGQWAPTDAAPLFGRTYPTYGSVPSLPRTSTRGLVNSTASLSQTRFEPQTAIVVSDTNDDPSEPYSADYNVSTFSEELRIEMDGRNRTPRWAGYPSYTRGRSVPREMMSESSVSDSSREVDFELGAGFERTPELGDYGQMYDVQNEGIRGRSRSVDSRREYLPAERVRNRNSIWGDRPRVARPGYKREVSRAPTPEREPRNIVKLRGNQAPVPQIRVHPPKVHIANRFKPSTPPDRQDNGTSVAPTAYFRGYVERRSEAPANLYNYIADMPNSDVQAWYDQWYASPEPSESDAGDFHQLPPWQGRGAELFRNFKLDHSSRQWIASETEISEKTAGTLTDVCQTEFQRNLDALGDPPWRDLAGGPLTPFTEELDGESLATSDIAAFSLASSELPPVEDVIPKPKPKIERSRTDQQLLNFAWLNNEQKKRGGQTPHPNEPHTQRMKINNQPSLFGPATDLINRPGLNIRGFPSSANQQINQGFPSSANQQINQNNNNNQNINSGYGKGQFGMQHHNPHEMTPRGRLQRAQSANLNNDNNSMNEFNNNNNNNVNVQNKHGQGQKRRADNLRDMLESRRLHQNIRQHMFP